MDDTSTNIANDRARLGSSLRLDENQTVISGMTTDTPRSSSSSNPHRRQHQRNLEAAASASSLPHDKFRGGTASRFISGGSSVGSGGSGGSSRRQLLGRSSGGSSVAFDVISEEEGGEEQEDDDKFTQNDVMGQQQQQYVASSNYMDAPSSSIPVSSSSSSVVVDKITQDEQQNILLSAYDNARLPTHNPKSYATQEINVSDYQDVIYDADELSSLPEEYLLDEYGNRYHTSRMVRERLLHSEQQQQQQQQTRTNNDTVTLLLPSSSSSSLLDSKRRWTTSLVTIFAAVALAIMGIIFSIQSLSSIDYSSSSNVYDKSNDDERQTPPLLLQPVQYRQFPNVLGGLLSWGGDVGCDNTMGGGDNIHCRQQSSDSSNGGGSSSSSSEILLASPHLRTSSLTSSPLRSYVPPLEKRMIVPPTINPIIDNSYMDVSILPYNPRYEIPMVWNVPLSDGGSTVELVFGNCLKLVQCNGRGHEILSREHALEFGGTRAEVDNSSSSSSRRAMMKVVPKTDDGHLLQYPREFNPQLQTDVVYTSTFVNVDCTTPSGIDRGILHNLATSDMSDVIHSPDIYDVARLFVQSSILSSPPTPNKKTFGRGMVVLRNPIEMAVAKYLRWKTFEDDNEYCARHWARGDVICKLYWTHHPHVMVKDMSLNEFAKSGESLTLLPSFCNVFLCIAVALTPLYHVHNRLP
jgi:hypothetical protein